jgi:hypothetical protein
MYAVAVNNRQTNATSYDAATKAAKSTLADVAQNIRTNPRLFRSPKTRTAVARLVASQTLPKKAGNVERVIGGVVTLRIVKD